MCTRSSLSLLHISDACFFQCWSDKLSCCAILHWRITCDISKQGRCSLLEKSILIQTEHAGGKAYSQNEQLLKCFNHPSSCQSSKSQNLQSVPCGQPRTALSKSVHMHICVDCQCLCMLAILLLQHLLNRNRLSACFPPTLARSQDDLWNFASGPGMASLPRYLPQ